MRIVHLTTVDLSLRYLILPQLEAAAEIGDSYGISAPGPHVAELQERGIRHVGLPASTRGMNLLGDLRAAGQFWKAIRKIRPDIVHTHNPKPGVYGRLLSRIAGVPIVVNTVHGLYATPESPLLKRLVVYGLEAIASRFSDAELIQNHEDLALLRRMRIVPPSKLQLLGNGVDLTRFNPSQRAELRDSERERLGIQHDEIAVGTVGRLVAEKGIPELIEAAGSLSDNVKVFVAGPTDPDKGDALAPQMLSYGRRAGVIFAGMREDIDSFYSALDVFVLPSHREGFPRAAMEAAAMGLPLIVTNIRGCRQVVEDGVNGLLIPVRDPHALAWAVNRVAADPALRSKMALASVAKAHAEFDEVRVVEIVMDTYRRLARSKGLGWKVPAFDDGVISLRQAKHDDSLAIATLHAETIGSGFLASLGSRFLNLLYRALIESEQGVVIVAESDSRVVAFVAGTRDTKVFYREFVRRHWLAGGLRVIPSLLRPSVWRKVWETMRYGSVGDREVRAELLAMAVAPVARRRGVGSQLVKSLTLAATEESIEAMKVVVGAGNAPAIALYEVCGFGEPRTTEVHQGEQSLELVWRAPAS